jgi:adenosylcobyric acid synthase
MEPDLVKQADIIIIPGSKNTIQDLQAIYGHGLDEVIHTAHRDQKTIIGICGGYQMLGEEIHDPLQIESEQKYSKGLGLLPVKTTLAQTKQTFQKQFYYRGNMTETCKGYEIHMGVTHTIQEESPVSVMEDGTMDGYYLNDHCWGSYIHGIFDNPAVLRSLFKNYDIEIPSIPPQAYKEKQYDLLADWVRKAVDVNRIYTIIQAQ